MDRAPDTAAPDTAAPDTAAPDTAAPDTAAPDTAAPDTAAPDAVLRDRGFRVTAQRLAVLRAVSPGRHLTADEVAEAARAEVGAISLQAVYDALAVLTDVGLVRRLQPAGSPTLFEARVRDNHHHLICRVCGRMSDVDCAIGSAPCLTPADDHGFDIDEAEVIFWGRCPQCRDATSVRPSPAGAKREGRHF